MRFSQRGLFAAVFLESTINNPSIHNQNQNTSSINSSFLGFITTSSSEWKFTEGCSVQHFFEGPVVPHKEDKFIKKLFYSVTLKQFKNAVTMLLKSVTHWLLLTGRLKVNMGNIYLKQRNYSKAIKFYRMALDRIPSFHKEMRWVSTSRHGFEIQVLATVWFDN